MPERWRRHQAGQAEPDLSGMELHADWCCPWRTGSLRLRAGLRIQPRRPEATFAAWLGHSVAVSRMHYTAPTDTEFERIAKQGTPGSYVG